MKSKPFRLSKVFIENNSFICTDKYFEFAAPIPGMTYTKREGLYSFETWRGYHIGPIAWSPKRIFDRVIVVGHSDMALSRFDSLPLKLLGARKVFGVNAYPLGNFTEPIPLGLTNHTTESELHLIYGNNQHLIDASESTNENDRFVGKIYANFSTWTYKSERSPLLTYIKKLPFVNIEEMSASKEGRMRFLSNLRTHDFVLCPRGNGIDTHRVWETLYMGGIPIVRIHPIMQKLLADLPVLFIEEWSEIANSSFLEEKWHQLRDMKYNYEKLSIQFWMDYMKEYISPQRLHW